MRKTRHLIGSLFAFTDGMYWKIDQRLPLDGMRDTSPFQSDRAAPRPSGEAFADLLNNRIDTPSHSAVSSLADILSTETVRLLAMALNPPTNDRPPSTMEWMASFGNIAARQLAPQAAAPAVPPPAITPATNPPATDSPATSIPTHIAGLIDKAAAKYHLDPALLTSVIEQESAFDPRAVSPAGAQGLMQLMPGTAQDLKVADAFDPAQNIDGGSRYLAGLIQRYHGNVKLALAAYNWGMGNLENKHHSMPSETRHYVANIMQNWQQRKSELA